MSMNVLFLTRAAPKFNLCISCFIRSVLTPPEINQLKNDVITLFLGFIAAQAFFGASALVHLFSFMAAYFSRLKNL